MLFTAYYEENFNDAESEDFAAVVTIDALTWPAAMEKALQVGFDRRLNLDSLARES